MALSQKQRQFFRDELRHARAAALLNAEGFDPIVVAMERLGGLLNPAGKGFGDYKRVLLEIARVGKHGEIDGCMPEVISNLDALFASVKTGRNASVHEGAHARHLVRHCVELALAVEDGLMADSRCVADFMVRSPVCAEPWQPVAFARQQMLVNSFSYLPVQWEGAWSVLSDRAVARFIGGQSIPAKALKQTIEEAVASGELALESAYCVLPEATVKDVLRETNGGVVLVTSIHGSLLGIATFFDFL